VPITAVDIVRSCGECGTEIETVERLPLRCKDGHKVKVVGASEIGDTTDDYYVQFEADVAGAFGEGRWVESLGFLLETDWDPDTMPHQLVSKEDDALGTVTGSPYSVYFEWGPIAWDSRASGDDDSNPFAGVVDRYVSEVFWHRGRFGLLADQSVVLSEVNGLALLVPVLSLYRVARVVVPAR